MSMKFTSTKDRSLRLDYSEIGHGRCPKGGLYVPCCLNGGGFRSLVDELKKKADLHVLTATLNSQGTLKATAALLAATPRTFVSLTTDAHNLVHPEGTASLILPVDASPAAKEATLVNASQAEIMKTVDGTLSKCPSLASLHHSVVRLLLQMDVYCANKKQTEGVSRAAAIMAAHSVLEKHPHFAPGDFTDDDALSQHPDRAIEHEWLEYARESTRAPGARPCSLETLQRSLPYLEAGVPVFETILGKEDVATAVPRLDETDVLPLLRGGYASVADKVVSVKKLESYDDVNYRLKCAGDETFLFKCFNPFTADADYIECQGDFMRFLRAALAPHAIGVAVPVESTSHTQCCEHGYLRVQTWLPGVQLSSTPFGEDTAFEIGSLCGLVTKCLESFGTEPCSKKLQSMVHGWDYAQTVDSLLTKACNVEDMDKRALVTQALTLYKAGILTHDLHRTVIHGDINWTNILVDGAGVVTGLCDYGDIQYTHRICELGTTIAYGVLERDNHQRVAQDIVRGYTKHFPIGDAERAVLPLAAMTRLSQSLIMGAIQYVANPENTYLLETQVPGWAALRSLMDAYNVDKNYLFRSCA